MKIIPFLTTITFSIITMNLMAQETGSFTDSRDSKVYKTVVVGTQIWMAENLAYKTDSGCYAYKNDTSNVTKYGYLYKWEIAKNVCPKGWHLPSDEEWTTMIDYLDGPASATYKLKEEGTAHWVLTDNEVSNETGFTALPGGNIDTTGTFNCIGSNGKWWCATEYDSKCAWYRNIYYKYFISRLNSNKKSGFSVRCIKD